MADAPTTATTSQAPPASSGLPQFDGAWWPGEMVWLLIIFAVVFALMAKVFVPRLSGTITEREDRIAGDIAQARKLKAEADVQAAQADADIAQARGRAQKLAAEAKARVQAEAAARQTEEEAKLAKTLAEAEAAIRSSRDEAMGHVRDIASDTALAIVEKLTGQPASAQDVTRALAQRT
jgi:F-type H+-transporting ATPase subunit b